jgi:hypothetical protein
MDVPTLMDGDQDGTLAVGTTFSARTREHFYQRAIVLKSADNKKTNP